jgi:hypothetical protein
VRQYRSSSKSSRAHYISGESAESDINISVNCTISGSRQDYKRANHHAKGSSARDTAKSTSQRSRRAEGHGHLGERSKVLSWLGGLNTRVKVKDAGKSVRSIDVAFAQRKESVENRSEQSRGHRAQRESLAGFGGWARDAEDSRVRRE